MKRRIFALASVLLLLCSAAGAQSKYKKDKQKKGDSPMTKTITFNALPQNCAELEALPQAKLTDPFEVSALVVAVLCRYEESPDDCIAMLNLLKGPQPLSNYEKQFLKDRLVGKYYVPRSYFNGTSPQNNYEPTKPYSVTISENAHSHDQEGYIMLWITSSGADSQRSVKLRKKGDQWFLWENYLMPDIRKPAAEDPWA
ncbi:MAG: hypothetical protein J6X11_09325 [Treponema sp.]|nr:hypothetical protein [Treponema sp.]